MIAQLRRYRRHMVALIIVGILLTVVSQMGAPSNGFLILGIVCIALGAALYTVVLTSGRKP